MSANENQVNIWWKPYVQASDKEILASQGKVVTTGRILPGIKDNRLYEAILEKDVSKTKYPNTKKWLVPFLVMNDAFRPENNGRVVVTEVSKTLHKQITDNPPPNYFDFNIGHNFNIVFKLTEGRGGNYYLDYTESHYDPNPSSVDANYVMEKMQEGRFSDFAEFVNRLNNPQQKDETAAPQNTVNNQAFSGTQTWTPPTGQQNAAPTQNTPPWNAQVQAKPDASQMETNVSKQFDDIF